MTKRQFERLAARVLRINRTEGQPGITSDLDRATVECDDGQWAMLSQWLDDQNAAIERGDVKIIPCKHKDVSRVTIASANLEIASGRGVRGTSFARTTVTCQQCGKVLESADHHGSPIMTAVQRLVQGLEP